MKFSAIAMLLAGAVCVSTGVAQSESSSPPTHDFATVKSDMLARLEKETACVQTATSFDGLHSCMPPPPGGAHHGPPPEEK